MIERLTRLELENFLTWKTLDWKPSQPVACLIGENDSGKSNLLRSFEFLAVCAQKPLHEVFHQNRLFSHYATPGSDSFRMALEGKHIFKDQTLDFRYELKVSQSFESGPAIVDEEILVVGDYELHRESERFQVVQKGEKQPKIQVSPTQTLLQLMASVSSDQPEIARALNNNPARAFARDLSHFVTVRLNAATIRAACEPDRPLLASGENLAAAVETLSANPEHRRAFKAVEERIQALLPRVRSVGVKSFRDDNGVSKRLLKFGGESAGQPFFFEADAASDGALYILALIVFSQNPNASGLSLIEEPELGLHPRLLTSFVDQLRTFAESQQVIMTTHSPTLLDSLAPEEVWVTTRDARGYSTLTNMADYNELDRWRDNFNTGEIWMNVAEAQLATTE